MLLSQRAQVWRQIANQAGGSSEQKLYSDIPCLVVPVSSFDRQIPYARESTHVVWVSRWLTLQKEDELRYGRRVDLYGNVVPFTFVVNGARRFVFGLAQRSYYATERE